MVCGQLTSRSRCSRCQPPKPPTAARGYGPDHKAERARWKPIVDAGQAACMETICLQPDRWIAPGEPWDLAHGPGQQGYRGAAHRRCNIAEANRRRARQAAS